MSFSRTAHARSPFLGLGAHFCPFQCFNPKGGKRNNLYFWREWKEKNGFLETDGAPLRGDTNYHVPNGFADSKMGGIG
jgi:hypothetical protein